MPFLHYQFKLTDYKIHLVINTGLESSGGGIRYSVFKEYSIVHQNPAQTNIFTQTINSVFLVMCYIVPERAVSIDLST